MHVFVYFISMINLCVFSSATCNKLVQNINNAPGCGKLNIAQLTSLPIKTKNIPSCTTNVDKHSTAVVGNVDKRS